MILIRFSLDWEELSALDRDQGRQRDCCQRIVMAWSAHGILVLLGGEGGLKRLVTLVSGMPLRTRKLWQEAMVQLRHRIMEVDGPIVEDLCSVEDLARLAGIVEIVGADGDRARLFGLEDDELSLEIAEHGVEVTRLYCVDDAPRLQAARRLAAAEIRKGDRPAEIWAARFAPLLPYSRHLVIVDRYCGQDASREGHGGQSGLEFVLRHAWTTGISIRVFMAEPTPTKPAFDAELNSLRNAVRAIVDRLRRELGPRLASLAINRLPDREFAKFAHDRYLRFDRWVCNMDTGLEPFSGYGPWRERTLCELAYNSAEKLAHRQDNERRLELASSGILDEPAALDRVALDEDANE